MMRSIRYLYFKLYKLFAKLNGNDDIPEYTAMLGIGTLFFFNILSIFSIVNLGYHFSTFPEIPRATFFVFIGIPYLTILYFSFIFSGKYKKIIEEFKNESERKRKAGRKIVLYYLAVTLVLFIFSLILMIMRNEGAI